MKACVLTDWKRLEIKELPLPLLNDDEVLVEVLYGGICGSDVTVMNHNHLTATVPRILCHEILGVVKEIRSEKSLPYKVGDKVCVFPLISCGKCGPCLTGHTSACSHLQIRGVHIDGGFAEYCKADIDSIIPVPEDIPDRIAVLTEPLSVGFHANMRAGTKPGDTVLVTGGGPIGILSAIVAKYFGAKKVLLTEVNDERLKLASEMGIEALDPTKEDVLAKVEKMTGKVGADVVLEASGAQASYDLIIPACKECGAIVSIGIPSQARSFRTNMFILKEIRMTGTRCCPKDEFARTVDMLGDMYRNQLFPLEKMICAEYDLDHCAEGLAEMQAGKNNGKILIKVKGE
ncbi:MAG: alcohol dehydrogenase catalytic domain-containing protein [Lachnospiraceae bacterium]|nr:alcohol dehydrogenase catalytic domain-containing protein [Lachnospiraceae bacterium]